MDFTEFVVGSLPPPPSTVLEVGCGAGELALQLAGSGHAVTAIDPEAPSGDIFEKCTLEDFEPPSTFQAVVANRSLHHIHDLDVAFRKIHALLDPDGVVIVNEFAWDRMDAPTARWYLSRVTEPKHHDEALRPENFPAMWVEEHAEHHPSSVLRDRLEAHFRTETFEWVPYIARHHLDGVVLEDDEAMAISEGHIRALGFRFMGRKTG